MTSGRLEGNRERGVVKVGARSGEEVGWDETEKSEVTGEDKV